MELNTSITFQNPPPVSGMDTLWIEAEGWETDENQISFADLYQHVGSQVLNISTVDNPYDSVAITPPSHDCGIVDGQIKNTIYVYRANPGLSYSLKHSYGSLGTLGDKSTEEISFEEVFNFNIGKTATLSYPNLGNINVMWQGVVYDANGNVISPPSYSVQDNSITLSEKIYGSLKVSYTLYRDAYDLHASPGEDSDLFGGVIYALYSGGISWLEIATPPEITAALLNGDVDCGYQWGNLSYDFSGLRDLDPNIPTDAPKVDTEITTDYCSQEVISVEQTYV